MPASRPPYADSSALRNAPPFFRSGVLVLSGFGIKLRVDCGHLCAEWGVGLKRYSVRLSRVDFGAKRIHRIVCIGADGYVTLDALDWLSNCQCSFIMLDRLGKVLFVTGPTSPSDPRLRIAQVLAFGNGTALTISKILIEAKLQGQERLVQEKLKNAEAADVIAEFMARVPSAKNMDAVRGYEARAAVAYWNSWQGVPVMWPKADSRKIPKHWRTFGTRASVLTGGPRLATNPPNAILNFCFALCESSARQALNALGLDSGIGYLHLPRANRDSLALDIMEPIRPEVERWLLSWLMTEPFSRKDFFEQPNGNCRISSDLCKKLSGTAPTWAKLIAPWGEFVAEKLASTIRSRSPRPFVPRLTQAHKRAAHGNVVPPVPIPKAEHVCSGCGTPIPAHKKLCLRCWKRITPKNFRAGRKMAQSMESLVKRAATQRQQIVENRAFDPSILPAWLTRDCYLSRIVTALAKVPKAQIRSALGISEPYATFIQNGTRIPHRRHWLVLARLAGISIDDHLKV